MGKKTKAKAKAKKKAAPGSSSKQVAAALCRKLSDGICGNLRDLREIF